MKKYILAGSYGVAAYKERNFQSIAGDIINDCTELVEISSLAGLDELLAQLEGWDKFTVITADDAVEIWKAIAKLHSENSENT